MGVLQDIFENINRTSFGGVNTVLNAVQAAKNEAPFDPLGSFGKGASLEETPQGSQILDEFFGQMSPDASVPEKIVHGTVGLLADIAFDPLTYVGVGGLTKVGEAAKIFTGFTKGNEALKAAGEAGKVWQAGSEADKALSGVSDINKIFGETLAKQGELGQRGLLTFMGKSVLGSKMDAVTLGMVDQAKNYLKTLPVIGDAINSAKEMFSTKSGIPEVDNAIQTFLGRMNEMGKVPMAIGENLNKLVKGMTKDDVELISKHILRPDEMPLQALKPTHIAAAAAFKDYMGKVANVEMAKGILKHTIDNYMPTMAADGFYDFMHKIGTRVGMKKSELDATLANALPKEVTKGVTASEANRAVKLVIGNKLNAKDIQDELLQKFSPEGMAFLDGVQRQAAQFGIKKVGDFFHDDLAVLAATRGVKSAKAIATGEFIDTMKKFGIEDTEFNKLDKSKLFGYRKAAIKGLEGHNFPNDVARALERWHKMSSDDKYAQVFTGMYKSLINVWKRWTLTIFPEYHARNLVGNAWNNFLASGLGSNLADIRHYFHAGAIQKAALKGGKALDDIKMAVSTTGETLTGRQIISEMEHHNLLDTGMTATETAESVANKYKPNSLNPLNENFGLIRGGRKVGNLVENNAKIAQYLYLRKQGYQPAEITDLIKSSLFDYGALTPFERNYMRYIFPFYTWSKNNIPFQIKNLIMQPEKFSRISKVKNEIENEQGTKGTGTEWMPQWMKDSLPIIVDKLPENERFQVMLLMSWLPAGDIQKIFDPIGLAKNSLEPFSKEVLQQISGRDFFLGHDIENYPGERNSFLGIDMEARTEHVLKMFRILNFLDQMNPGGIFGKKGEASSFWGMKPINIPTPVGDITIGAKRRLIDLPASQRILKSGTGLKMYPFDVQQSKTYELAAINKQLQGMQVMKKKFQKQGDEANFEKISKIIDKLKQSKIR